MEKNKWLVVVGVQTIQRGKMTSYAAKRNSTLNKGVDFDIEKEERVIVLSSRLTRLLIKICSLGCSSQVCDSLH